MEHSSETKIIAQRYKMKYSLLFKRLFLPKVCDSVALFFISGIHNVLNVECICSSRLFLRYIESIVSFR